jgi:hypothetical protein
VWKHSYIYRSPGDLALYWYAQVVYENLGHQPVTVKCNGPVLVFAEYNLPGSNKVQENMSGTPDSGMVNADETLCSHDPNYIRMIDPGGKHYDWAIFHNVPWNRILPGAEKSLVSLQWGSYGPSQPAYLWYKPLSNVPEPVECPPELVTLKTCQEGEPQGKMPNGQPSQNLVVLVHGCCTDAAGLWEWKAFADQIVGEIINSNPSAAWEVVVRDWTNHTPTSPIPLITFPHDASVAFLAAPGDGKNLAVAINKYPYRHLHLIGHSAGAKLIDIASQNIKDKTIHIHLTFLDAYAPPLNEDYGSSLKDYSWHYAEHYVDIGSLFGTDTILPYALNFDVTNWEPLNDNLLCDAPGSGCLNEKTGRGHQWPRYWYEKSVTTPTSEITSGYKFGYHLSLEGSGNLDQIQGLVSKWPAKNPPYTCELGGVDAEAPASCDFTRPIN